MRILPADFTKNRIFGLDLLRFFAIMMVVVGHSCIMMPNDLAPKMHRFLLDGVAIFFVLSGFLIGGILIRLLEKDKRRWKDLVNFWKRRWMRTIPAYFVVLTFLMIYGFFLLPKRFPEIWYKYYFFIHNFFRPRPGFFGESWSLSVEEWFYLLIPLLIFAGILLLRLKVKVSVLLVTVLVIAGVILYRVALYQSLLDQHFETVSALRKAGDALITYQVVPRLDALMFGVLGAWVAYYYPAIWSFKGKFFVAVLAVAVLYYFKRDNAMHYAWYDGVWSHVVKSVAVLLTLPFLSSWRVKENMVTRSVTFISVISYSMYLVNWTLVLHIIIKNGIYQNFTGKWIDHENWGIDYALFWTLTISLSYAMYRWVETPFMKLRAAEK